MACNLQKLKLRMQEFTKVEVTHVRCFVLLDGWVHVERTCLNFLCTRPVHKALPNKYKNTNENVLTELDGNKANGRTNLGIISNGSKGMHS
jgi:hypothetical protein